MGEEIPAVNICGATDIPLTERGHRQATETGRKFSEQGIRADEILYSPLIRAAETASKEFHLAKQQFVTRYDGGESMLRLAQRIYNLLDDIKAEAKSLRNYPLIKTYSFFPENSSRYR